MPGYPVKLVTRCGCERLMTFGEPVTHVSVPIVGYSPAGEMVVSVRRFEPSNIDSADGHHVYREVE